MLKTRWMVLALLVGCSNVKMTSGVGVTAGGSQDITLARELIGQGLIPDQEHYTAEGLLSEHDLPLSEAACESVLCPQADASLYAPADGGEGGLLVQLGFGTSITLENFERPDLDLVAVVDISGSMSGEMPTVREALLAMVDQLDKDDHMSLVLYGNRAKTEMDRTRMNRAGREAMVEKIRAIKTGGSTDMESGMVEGYAQLQLNSGQSHRMLVFSDAQPNTGVTEQSQFLKLVRSRSEKGVGTTLFGVGWDMGSELADALSKVEGGSYHFLTAGELDRLFVEEFDFLVSPVAYDLSVTVSPCSESTLSGVYGAPVDGRDISLGASTLFLSSRSGGMGALFTLPPEVDTEEIATMALRYRPVGSESYKEHTLTVGWEGGAYIEDADGLGVYKMTGLIDEYRALLAASRFCDGMLSKAAALASIDAASARLLAQSDAIGDAPLADEAALLDALRVNVEAGQANCAEADAYYY